MIEKMKQVSVVSTASHKEELLQTLRELGILHLSEKKTADPVITERFAELSRVSTELTDYLQGGAVQEELLSDQEFEELHRGAVHALSLKKELDAKKTACFLEAEKISAWGDFDPKAVLSLKDDGFDLHFYRMGNKELEQLKNEEAVQFIRLSSVEKMEAVAVLGTLPASIPAVEFTLPAKSYSQLKQEERECEDGIAACDALLKKAAAYQKSYQDQLLKVQNAEEYSAVSRTADGEDGLVWLNGYIPADEATRFTEEAQSHGWAWAMDDIADDDEKVPTKIRYNKVTALMKPVFDILGTVPAYREFDISLWFLLFFALFTAMIIGDAGYGVVFLIVAVILNVKQKKVNDVTLLLYVLSGATIIWGSLTGTWFGLETAMQVPFLKALVIPDIANYPEYFGVSATAAQNAVMKFCFTIGLIQLVLACALNIRRKIAEKNLSWIADLGWAMSISSLYFLVLFLVIGQTAEIGTLAAIIGVGFVLVLIFGGMAPDKTFVQGLKAGLGNAFTTFLDTISAFGNVMSYIRLFAVGMASLAIAQSFNNMASGFSGALVIVGALIMIIGHTLNIVMGLLSVVVHGVRLNLLEFSGQLGMEWSGTAYDPFRKSDKIKK